MEFMGFTLRESITILHGMVMGAIVLLVFPAVLAGLWCLRPEWITSEGLKKHLALLTVGTWIISIFSWLTVIIGSYLPYAWYRLKPPAGAHLTSGLDLTKYPAAYLLSQPNLAAWEEVAMEWKEHAGWIVPILSTTVAFLVTYYNSKLFEEPQIRKALFTLLSIAFVVAAMCGLLGAFITKIAPVQQRRKNIMNNCESLIDNGIAAAALIGAGIGCFALGLLTFLTKVSSAIENPLDFYAPTGPVSGITTLALVVWLVAWVAVHVLLRNRLIDFHKVYIVALVLVGLGVLGCFPFFEAPEWGG